MADYYWSRSWTDWSAFRSDREREVTSERRRAVRRAKWPISPCKPLPPYQRSAKQAAWENEWAARSNDRRFREIAHGRD